MICDQCNVELHVGDYPFCHGDPTAHTRSASTVIGDEIPGGMVVENGFPEPIRVYSHSEHRRLLAERGLEIRAKWAGPQDKHLKPWHTVDLEAAKTLLERGAQARQAKADLQRAREEFPITVTDLTFEATS